MYSGTQEGNSLNLNLTHDHNVAKINDAIGFLPKAWCATKKYSVNNTLPIAAVNAWFQFSLAYVAAMIITHNDLSFITTFNSTLMPTYFLVSAILGAVIVASLIIKHMNKQEIKDGDSPIDEKIRGGKSDEINEIAQNALTIEIVPDLVNKKQDFSIVLPISEKQGEILENKRQENRNKVILLTVPYVLSGLIVAGALIQNKFSFANVQGWGEWGFIAFVSAVFIAGICIALGKLKSNEVNNTYNVVKKFNNLDILLPCRKGSVVSVMENKFKSEEENDPISRLERLFDKHLTDLINKICYLFKNDLLGLANANIEKTLDGMKKDVATLLNKLEEIIKQNLDGVEATANEAITQCLVNIDKSVDELCKGVGKDVQNKLGEANIKDLANNISRLAETFEDRMSRLNPGDRMGLAGANFADTRLPNAPRESRGDQSPQGERASSNEEHDEEHAQRVDWKEGVKEIGQLKKQIEALKRALEEKENNSGTSPQTSSTSSNGPQRDEEEILDEELARLGKEERIEEKREKIKNLKEARPKQKEIKEWKEKINGNPSEFLHYILESIKLEEKDNKEEKAEATLRDFDNKIIIYWKDGSQTTCHIKKQGDLQIESSATMFTDPNVQAAWEMARGKSL